MMSFRRLIIFQIIFVTFALAAKSDVQMNADLSPILEDIPPVPVITNGAQSEYAPIARDFPIEATVNQIDLIWHSPSQVQYSVDFSLSDPSIMSNPSLSIGSSGTVPSTETTYQFKMPKCLKTGTVYVTIKYFFSKDQTQYDPVELEFQRSCVEGVGIDPDNSSSSLPSETSSSSVPIEESSSSQIEASSSSSTSVDEDDDTIIVPQSNQKKSNEYTHPYKNGFIVMLAIILVLEVIVSAFIIWWFKVHKVPETGKADVPSAKTEKGSHKHRESEQSKSHKKKRTDESRKSDGKTRNSTVIMSTIYAESSATIEKESQGKGSHHSSKNSKHSKHSKNDKSNHERLESGMTQETHGTEMTGKTGVSGYTENESRSGKSSEHRHKHRHHSKHNKSEAKSSVYTPSTQVTQETGYTKSTAFEGQTSIYTPSTYNTLPSKRR